MIRAILLALGLSLAPASAYAHRLVVFVLVEGSELVVEAKFSTGRIPVSGEVRIKDAEEALLSTHALGEDGTIRLPLDPEAKSEGLLVEVETGEGHSDYWILTPEDIKAGEQN